MTGQEERDRRGEAYRHKSTAVRFATYAGLSGWSIIYFDRIYRMNETAKRILILSILFILSKSLLCALDRSLCDLCVKLLFLLRPCRAGKFMSFAVPLRSAFLCAIRGKFLLGGDTPHKYSYLHRENRTVALSYLSRFLHAPLGSGCPAVWLQDHEEEKHCNRLSAFRNRCADCRRRTLLPATPSLEVDLRSIRGNRSTDQQSRLTT
jgi:hypothetical protein